MFRENSYIVISSHILPEASSPHRTEILKSSHWILHLYFKIICSSQTDLHYIRSRIKSVFHLLTSPFGGAGQWTTHPQRYTMSMLQSLTYLIRGCIYLYQKKPTVKHFVPDHSSHKEVSRTARAVTAFLLGQHLHSTQPKLPHVQDSFTRISLHS